MGLGFVFTEGDEERARRACAAAEAFMETHHPRRAKPAPGLPERPAPELAPPPPPKKGRGAAKAPADPFFSGPWVSSKEARRYTGWSNLRLNTLVLGGRLRRRYGDWGGGAAGWLYSLEDIDRLLALGGRRV